MGSAASVFKHDISNEEFKSIVGDVLYSDALFHKLKNSSNNIVPNDIFMKYISVATDCFLTHDWGKDELGRENHKRVSIINKRLKDKGIRTWFDEDTMKGDIQQQMGDGIDNCGCVIVFITSRYMEKVTGKGEKKELDNCLYEFSHAALSKGRSKMVGVVMEPRCRDTGIWYGKVGQNLAGLLYVDYTQDDNLDRVVDEIYQKVIDIVKIPIEARIQSYLSQHGPIGSESKSSSTPPHENSLELVQFFEEQVGCASSKAAQYTKLLVDQGIQTLRKLQLRYQRDNTILQSIGFEQCDIEDIVFCLNARTDTKVPEVEKTNISANAADTAKKDEKHDINISLLIEQANNGSDIAAHTLGTIYFFGQQGMPLDYNESAKWFRKAADQGHVHAQGSIGWCYETGNGVTQDYNEAHNWYRKAADGGDANAQCSLGWWYENGFVVSQDLNEAVKLYRKAAEQGHGNAQCNLGQCYFNGRGVSQDEKEAVAWYRKAAEQGVANAFCNLAWCYDTGRGVPQDHQEALKWYRKAAESGDANAQCTLGWWYENGHMVAQNDQEAVHWYRLAADKGHVNAQCNLGICYSTGRGVAQDNEAAIEWLRKAAAQGHSDAAGKLLQLENNR